MANFFPSFSLTGDYGNESIALRDIFTSPTRSWFYLLNVYQPIFTGGRLISDLDLHRSLEIQALYYYEQAILIAFREVDDALIAHQNSLRLLQEQKKLVETLVDYLALALQYANGESDYLNVLDAERRLFAAQLDFAQIQSDTFLTLIELYRALGGGW